MPAPVQCPDRLRLSDEVVEAVKRVYAAKTVQEQDMARITERKAILALEAHRKEHGC
jgi:hypothetical protein